MRLTHPTRLAALLAPLMLAAPLAAQIPGGLRTTAPAQAPGNGSTIIVWPRHVQSLQARLDSLAVALPAEERALWDGVLLRAAHAPTPAEAEVRVTPVLQIGPGGGCDAAPGVNEAANRVAIVVQGGRQVRNPRTGAVIDIPERADIGPRPEDPTRPPQSLARRIAEFARPLPAEERGVLEWLLTRASSTDVGLPPGPCNPERGCRAPAGGSPVTVSLRQALGIEPLAIGAQPARGRTEERWILRY